MTHGTNTKCDDQEWLRLAAVVLLDAALDDFDVDRADILTMVVENGAFRILAVLT